MVLGGGREEGNHKKLKNYFCWYALMITWVLAKWKTNYVSSSSSNNYGIVTINNNNNNTDLIYSKMTRGNQRDIDRERARKRNEDKNKDGN